MPYTITKYRIYEYKGVDYLLYKKFYTFLWIFKWEKWEVIPYPNEKKKVNVICSKIYEYRNLKKFIIKYPDIDEYFKSEYIERKNKFK